MPGDASARSQRQATATAKIVQQASDAIARLHHPMRSTDEDKARVGVPAEQARRDPRLDLCVSDYARAVMTAFPPPLPPEPLLWDRVDAEVSAVIKRAWFYRPVKDMDLQFGDEVPCSVDDCHFKRNADRVSDYEGAHVLANDHDNIHVCDVDWDNEQYESLEDEVWTAVRAAVVSRLRDASKGTHAFGATDLPRFG
jgi:hypothetical protein